MRKWGAALLAALFVLVLASGCNAKKRYQDGEYTATFREYNSRGYKEYVTVTVSENRVTAVVFDGIDPDGNRLSEDETLAEDMQKLQETNPNRYGPDLINQYLNVQSAQDVDAIAGATNSTNAFKALLTALEPQMREGNTEALVIDNIVEK